VRRAPEVPVERTSSIEEMITARILENSFDSVIPKRAPTVEKSESPELSQEKSSFGLGDLYEKVRVTLCSQYFCQPL
jgi:U3 small nucleolar ribonucleoprotein component